MAGSDHKIFAPFFPLTKNLWNVLTLSVDARDAECVHCCHRRLPVAAVRSSSTLKDVLRSVFLPVGVLAQYCMEIKHLRGGTYALVTLSQLRHNEARL